MPKITKRTVDAIVTPEKRGWVWDTEVKGFGIATRPTGTHSYVFNYRDRHGRMRNVTIGKVGTMTPDEARKRAEKLRRDVQDGISPLAEKRAARKALTVNDLFDAYLKSDGKNGFLRKAASTQSTDRGRITRHLRPLLGKHILEALTAEDVADAHRKIVTGKTAVDVKTGKYGRAVVKGGEGTARKAMQLFRAMLNWAKDQKLLPAGCDPDMTAGLDLGRDGKRSAILGDADAYAAFWQVLDRMADPARLENGEKLIRPEVADAIRLVVLTGCRRGDVRGLRWRHVDLRQGLITLDANEHKAGHLTGEQRKIGLPAMAQAIIARQPAGQPEDKVFRPARGGENIDLNKPIRAVRDAVGLPKGAALHLLRHSLASHMAMNGAQAFEIKAALGHADIATSQKYVHWAEQRQQELAERAASGIVAAISGNKGGEIVKLKKERN